VWREGGDLEKLSGGHGRGRGGKEEEEEEKRKGNGRRWKRMWRREEGVIATSVEVVQSAFIERAYRNC